MYEKFTDPTPHSFVMFSSTTKLGLGLPNKAMNNVRVSYNRTRQKKKKKSASFFCRVFIEYCEIYCEFFRTE